MIWLVALGGSIGAALRYIISIKISTIISKRTTFPIATFLINMLGSFFLGILANFHVNGQINEWLWFLLGTGFCGAFTTFSTFGYETLTLIREKKYRNAISYVIGSVLIGLITATIGFLL